MRVAKRNSASVISAIRFAVKRGFCHCVHTRCVQCASSCACAPCGSTFVPGASSISIPCGTSAQKLVRWWVVGKRAASITELVGSSRAGFRAWLAWLTS